MNKTYLAIGVVLFLALGSVLFYQRKAAAPVEEIPEGVACTMDAMQCPDGSYVGRTGPNCEFHCPNTPATPTPKPTPTPIVKQTNTAHLGEKILYGDMYITPLQVTEDSRCPAGVECFWAGRVVLRAKLEKNKKTQEVIFDSSKGTAVGFEGMAIALVKVGPRENYTFTFDYLASTN